jgi:hypothetical protein
MAFCSSVIGAGAAGFVVAVLVLGFAAVAVDLVVPV